MLKKYSISLDLYDYYRNSSPCVFDPRLKWENLCHLQSRSIQNINLIKRKLNCDEQEAQFFIDIPLINVVPGSRTWNGTNEVSYKVGDYKDVKFISDSVIEAALHCIDKEIFSNPRSSNLEMILDFYLKIEEMKRLEIADRVDFFKKLHEQYIDSVIIEGGFCK